ncbi:MAG: hemerythrin domain-containing protein [Thermoplasmataceae archaeon]
MIEHTAIRKAKWMLESPYDQEKFSNFLDYLERCHIEIEEKVCFPVLETFPFADSADFSGRVRRIKADHKLLATLGNNITKWANSGNIELAEMRLPLFYRTLVDHNLSEDNELFPRWIDIGKEDLNSTMREALSIISTFSTEEYLKVTGLNEEMFRYIFRIS